MVLSLVSLSLALVVRGAFASVIHGGGLSCESPCRSAKREPDDNASLSLLQIGMKIRQAAYMNGDPDGESINSDDSQSSTHTHTPLSMSLLQATKENQTSVQKYEESMMPEKDKCVPPPSANATASDFSVDMVYSWVAQPSEKEYDGVVKDCPHLQGGITRFRDLGTFPFSLRMLEQNLPWVRKIFIVAAGGVPDWLNTSNPRIQVIMQEDLWSKDSLQRDRPIHNSQAVEAHIHRIPGLMTHFIYANDDMFAGRPLERSFFFTDHGMPLIYADKPDTDVLAGWCMLPSPGVRPASAHAHQMISLTIPMIQTVQAQWPAVFEEISGAHCRGDIPVSWGPTWFYAWYGIHSGLAEVQSTSGVKAAILFDENRLSQAAQNSWYQDLLDDPPHLGCINDDFEFEVEARFKVQLEHLHAFMRNASNLSTSSFEKHTSHALLAQRE